MGPAGRCRLLLSSVDCNAGTLGVAADAGVKEIKDLRGKRVGFVVGSPALNQNSLAILAFAGLKQTDVKAVEFASYGAMWKGLINNDTDAAFGTTITGPAKEAETSPRGLIWPPLPASDTAGWERVKKVGSFFFPQKATCGAGITPDKPIEFGELPLPDLRDLCLATGGPDLFHHQGDDRQLRRLQGFRARRRRPRGRPPDQELGGAGTSRRGEGAEGSRPVERRDRKPTTTA